MEKKRKAKKKMDGFTSVRNNKKEKGINDDVKSNRGEWKKKTYCARISLLRVLLGQHDFKIDRAFW